jgi:hypothetical protein
VTVSVVYIMKCGDGINAEIIFGNVKIAVINVHGFYGQQMLTFYLIHNLTMICCEVCLA